MKRYFTLIVLLGTVLFTGCKSDKPGPGPGPVDPVDPDPKTLIMFGDINTFYTYNVSTAGAAVAKGALKEGQEVVYFRYNADGGTLYRLVKNASLKEGFESVVIKHYLDGISGFDPVKLRTIIEDAKEAAPANHYALSVGSHGRGWISYESWNTRSARSYGMDAFAPLFEQPENPVTRFMFGDSMTRRIEVDSFAKALEGMEFDFILLDQCLMGGIEVAYQFKDLAPYLIISPAEIIIYGFPFDKVVPRIFTNWNDLNGVCKDFIDYYKNSKDPYGTISLIKTSELPALAEAVKAIVDSQGGAVLTPAGGVDGLQYYEALSTHLFYDFGQYIMKSTDQGNTGLYNAFEAALNRAIPYKDHTASFLSGVRYPYNHVIPITYYSGLSAFVPDVSTAAFMASYERTAWYKAVYVN